MIHTGSGPNINDLKKNRKSHGMLISCSWHDYSGGMMFNSDASDDITVALEGNIQKIIHRTKLAFGGTTIAVYHAKTDVLKEIAALSERENLPAMEGLTYTNPIQMTDVSFSTSISLEFDDRPVGGLSRNRIHINVLAMRQQGARDVEDAFMKILKDGEAAGEQISFDIREGPSVMGMPGLISPEESGKPAALNPGTEHTTGITPPAGGSVQTLVGADSASGWTCKNCGFRGIKGRFCPECGFPKA